MPGDPNTPPAGGQQPVSGAVQRAFADPNAFVKLDIYGREQIVPVSEIVRDAQKYLAADEKLAGAKEIIANARRDEEAARQHRALMADLDRDPERTLQMLARQRGVSYAGGDNAQPHGGEGDRPASDPKTTELSQRLEQLERVQTRAHIEREMESTLDRFDLFKKDQFSRDNARLVMLAARTVDPNASLEQYARDYHTRRLTELGDQATAQRDNRQALAQGAPSIPVNVGLPDLSSIPQGTAAGLKSGGMRENIAAAARAFARQTGLASGT